MGAERRGERARRLAVSYAALLEAGEWRPIPGCPGRSVLQRAARIRPEDLVGAGARLERFEVAGARDPVLVAPVEGGGLISYAKGDGRFVHTLNTPEGFARKLAQLGIELA